MVRMKNFSTLPAIALELAANDVFANEIAVNDSIMGIHDAG